VLRGGFRPEHARSPLGDIEVEFEDAVLGEEQLEPPRDNVLLELSDGRPVDREVKVLGQLLRDRAASANLVAVREVIRQRFAQRAEITAIQPREILVAGVAELFAHGAPVDAVVIAEVSVFRNDHRALEPARDAVQRHPFPADLEFFAP
jgi:hypothetical protein